MTNEDKINTAKTPQDKAQATKANYDRELVRMLNELCAAVFGCEKIAWIEDGDMCEASDSSG